MIRRKEVKQFHFAEPLQLSRVSGAGFSTSRMRILNHGNLKLSENNKN